MDVTCCDDGQSISNEVPVQATTVLITVDIVRRLSEIVLYR